ncbi:septum formation family protein [Microbacterium sp. SD291]|uniref:septum formation family protein n=1 Tax=Microbacterium sp. SD291 TaxID=2782007 RepID=UPI001A95795B|nr:septum formation family protein [Microbacterium sp. SD291]MBO0981143.1 septum formation family protein [Microbacterium sp. SD291]
MMELRTRRALALAGSALALSVALTGCSALSGILGGGSGDADRDEETGQVTESSNIDIFSLKVGDCKMASATGMIEDADVVPCDQPHDEEVYYEFKMEDGEFSDEAINTATEECIGDAFTTFVGLGFNESVLEVYPITPTEQTWNEMNDRVIQCVISDPAGQVEVSLKGAAR